jgi:ribose-phosphate pyrophosphokinase
VGVVFKCRHDDGSVEILDVVGEVRDRNVVIVDDRVETGQTIAGAASRLKQLGARSIRAIVTHGAMTDGTLDDLWKSGVECLATTNTLPTLPPSPRVQTRDVTPRLADAVIRIHNNLPVVPYSR